MTPDALAVERDRLLEGGRTLEQVERMQRAADGRIEEAVVRYREALDLPSDSVWGSPDAVAIERTYNNAVWSLRVVAASIEGMTPPCAMCRLSGWIGDGVPCPDCDGNPQERIEDAG